MELPFDPDAQSAYSVCNVPVDSTSPRLGRGSLQSLSREGGWSAMEEVSLSRPLSVSLIPSLSLFVFVSPSDIKVASRAGARALKARLLGRTVSGLEFRA